MYTSLYLPKARYPESLQLGFYSPCDSSVGISEIAIVGVGDNHARKKGQDRLYYTTKVVRQTPKGGRTPSTLTRAVVTLLKTPGPLILPSWLSPSAPPRPSLCIVLLVL
jgi:hypothetical protein